MVGSGVLKRNCLHKQTRLFEVTNPGCTSQGSASMNFVSDQINPVAILDQERSSPAYQGFQSLHSGGVCVVAVCRLSNSKYSIIQQVRSTRQVR